MLLKSDSLTEIFKTVSEQKEYSPPNSMALADDQGNIGWFGEHLVLNPDEGYKIHPPRGARTVRMSEMIKE